LADALIVLRAARQAPPGEVREVILLASAGVEQSGCDAVRTAAREVGAQSVLLVTACAGAVCDRRCLAEAASAPRYAVRTGEWATVTGLLSDVRDSTGLFHPLQSFRYSDDPASTITLHAPAEIMDGPRVAAEMSPWPPASVVFQYSARPNACGRMAVSREVGVTVRFSDGHGEVLDVENPELDVACELPPTASPTAGPSRTPAPTVTAVPTPRPVHRLYLPLAQALGCLTGGALDLALVIDVSGSMAVGFPGFATRWHAAQQAAIEAIGALHDGDRVAVVAFADRPVLLQLLTSDHAVAARHVAEELPRADGSRVDLALEMARRELDRSSRRRAAVLFTDGDLNQTSATDLAGGISALAADGIGVRAVLFGDHDAALWDALLGRGRSVIYDPAMARSIGAGHRCR
jgi:hypothetical protein